jgi:protein SCO1/2
MKGAFVGAMFCGLGLVFSGCGGGPRTHAVAASETTPSPAKGAALAGGPAKAPDFALRDQHGRLIRRADERGRLVLLTFLYTRCPDVCPLIAENLNEVLRELGSSRAEVRVIAVTVDPEHDTPRAVRAFIREHRLLPEFLYVTGARRQLQRVWQNYNVLSLRRNTQRVDHSALTLLIDGRGEMRLYYPPNVTSEPVLRDVRNLLAGAGS